MTTVTVNDVPVPDKDLASLISLLTRTRTLGDTVIDAAEKLGVTVDTESMTATCENLDVLRAMADSDAVVSIRDEGKNPAPRTVTWGNLVRIAEIAVSVIPYAKMAESLGADAKGLVTFEETSKAESDGNPLAKKLASIKLG